MVLLVITLKEILKELKREFFLIIHLVPNKKKFYFNDSLTITLEIYDCQNYIFNILNAYFFFFISYFLEIL